MRLSTVLLLCILFLVCAVAHAQWAPLAEDAGAANPVGLGADSPTWANWQMSGPWLCAHLYEHYRFTADREFLRTRAYPLMRGAAEFCLAWLIEDGHGHLPPMANRYQFGTMATGASG
jgi:hypothetical protein